MIMTNSQVHEVGIRRPFEGTPYEEVTPKNIGAFMAVVHTGHTAVQAAEFVHELPSDMEGLTEPEVTALLGHEAVEAAQAA